MIKILGNPLLPWLRASQKKAGFASGRHQNASAHTSMAWSQWPQCLISNTGLFWSRGKLTCRWCGNPQDSTETLSSPFKLKEQVRMRKTWRAWEFSIEHISYMKMQLTRISIVSFYHWKKHYHYIAQPIPHATGQKNLFNNDKRKHTTNQGRKFPVTI